jgi:hypothetical protein
MIIDDVKKLTLDLRAIDFASFKVSSFPSFELLSNC